MRAFDYSFLLFNQIPSKTISLLVAIEKVKAEGKIYELKYPNVFNKLQKIAIVQSVKSSNAIEGIVTSDKRINSIVNDDIKPLNHDEEEIAGYSDVLKLIHEEHNSYDLNQRDILEFHKLLMSYNGFVSGGEYKKSDNVIIEKDMHGRRSIRFKPTSAKDTKDAMEQLELAFMDARSNSGISDLLLIPSVVLDFLSIHPFSDGNGRMSRLLTLLLLYKCGYIVGKYVSFEGVINDNKGRYYNSLKQSSNLWHENSNNYFHFINDFLETLLKCYNELYARFDIIIEQKDNKKTRIKETIMNSRKPISRLEIYKIWPDISLETIKKEITSLLKNKEIVKIGNFKDAKYIKK